MTGVVYFAGSSDSPIKVGYTINLDKRISAIKTAAPTPVKLLTSVPGNRKTESYFHARLRPHRLQGEWFTPHSEVLDLISKVQASGILLVPEEFRSPSNSVPRHRADDRSADIIESVRTWFQFLAEPLPFGEPMEKTLRRVAAHSDVSYRSLKAVWYGETTQIKADVYVGLKESYEEKMSSILSRQLRTLD